MPRDPDRLVADYFWIRDVIPTEVSESPRGLTLADIARAVAADPSIGDVGVDHGAQLKTYHRSVKYPDITPDETWALSFVRSAGNLRVDVPPHVAALYDSAIKKQEEYDRLNASRQAEHDAVVARLRAALAGPKP